jgi:hypothetical protein
MLSLAVSKYVGDDDAEVLRELAQRALLDDEMAEELERWKESALIFDTMSGFRGVVTTKVDGDGEGDGELNYQEYLFFHARLVIGFNEQNMLEGSTEALISEEEADKAAEEDWARDR